MLGLVAGWQGGWVGVSWQETQDKPVSGGRDGEDEGAGSPGPAPFLPHVLDLLFGELGRPCPGCLQRRVVSWLGLVNRAAVRRPFHLEADILPSDGKTEAQGTPTPSPVVPLGLKYLFWGSIGEARWDVGPDQSLHAVLGGRNLVTQTHNDLLTSPVPSLVQGMGKKCHTWC